VENKNKNKKIVLCQKFRYNINATDCSNRLHSDEIQRRIKMTQKITIQRIAELAGVNKATVSRVLNGSAAISTTTREKVEQIIKEYNYVPNSLAKGLASKKTFTIGLCQDFTNKEAFSNPFFYKVLNGIENIVYQQDYSFLMMSHRARAEGKSMFERVVSEHKVDGIIMPSSLFDDESHKLLESFKMPFVVLGEGMVEGKDIHWVDVDNEQAAGLLTRRLLKLGHKKIGIYSDKLTAKRDQFIMKRIQGYMNTMFQFGLQAFVETEIADIYKHDLEAIICCTHDQLFGLLDENKNEALQREVVLATFDDNPLFQYFKRPIHYVSVELEKMGEEAASLLFSIIEQAKDIPHQIQITTSEADVTNYS